AAAGQYSVAAGDYNLASAVQRAFASDPTNAAGLLIGTTEVIATTNAPAATPLWKAISGTFGGYVTALAIAPSAPQSVYAATSDGHVWFTSNGGANWPPPG